MPTKKRRVGFIPRNDVLDIINKLSYENNLSYSKIINILVEEALYNRGLLQIKNGEILAGNKKIDSSYKSSVNKIKENKEFNYNFKNKLLRERNLNVKEVKEESLDAEIYDKFLMFLQFKEKMKEIDLWDKCCTVLNLKLIFKYKFFDSKKNILNTIS